MSSIWVKRKPPRPRQSGSRSAKPMLSLALNTQISLLRICIRHLLPAFAVWFLLGVLVASEVPAANEKNRVGTVTVALTVGKPVTFLPDEAFGRAIDGLSQGEVDQVYTRQNIDRLETSGLRRV